MGDIAISVGTGDVCTWDCMASSYPAGFAGKGSSLIDGEDSRLSAGQAAAVEGVRDAGAQVGTGPGEGGCSPGRGDS